MDVAAFAGALLSTVLVFALARAGGAWYDGRGYDGGGAASRLLLTGIVVASGWSAAVSLLLAISPEASLRGLLFWLMGDFSFVERPAPDPCRGRRRHGRGPDARADAECARHGRLAGSPAGRRSAPGSGCDLRARRAADVAGRDHGRRRGLRRPDRAALRAARRAAAITGS